MLTTASKFLTAAEAGLVKWDTYKKPPYTTTEWAEAYNNSVNLLAKLKEINELGYSSVTLEKGDYPICYSNGVGALGNSAHLGNTRHSVIKGFNNFEINGGGSCFFVLFDSVNRSPYDTTTNPVKNLNGTAFSLIDNTNLEIHSLELRGDAYNRSWVDGERLLDSTNGFYILENNYDVKIDITGHGFRADAIAGATRGRDVIKDLSTGWYKGGVDDSTGADIEKTGAYRTGKIPLAGKTVKRNAVQIMSSGYLRLARFRNRLLDVYFYDINNVLIFNEKAEQCEFTYLPPNCAYIQYVAYDDERTTDEVDYGAPLILVSGTSEKCEIRGEYFNNMRGAISNMPNKTLVDANIYDISSVKYGNIPYNDPTKYGINNEDLYTSSLTVMGSITGCHNGILCHGKSLDVKAAISDLSGYAILCYGTEQVNIEGCAIKNVNSLYHANNNPLSFPSTSKKIHKISNNTIDGGSLYLDLDQVENIMVSIKDNIFTKAQIRLTGNGKNIIYCDNVVMDSFGQYSRVFDLRGIYKAKGNSFYKSVSSMGNGWNMYNVDALIASDNHITIASGHGKQNLLSYGNVTTVDSITFKGVTLNTNSIPLDITSSRSPEWTDRSEYKIIEDCEINDAYFRIESNAATLSNTTWLFKNVRFNNFIGIYLRYFATDGLANGSIQFKNCYFDLSSATYLIEFIEAISKTLKIEFIDCTFYSKQKKNIPLIKLDARILTTGFAGVTASAIGCRFINVRNAKTHSLL